MAKDVKNYRKEFWRYAISKQAYISEASSKPKENINPLLNKLEKLVIINTDKAEVLNTFFISVLTNTVGSQVL